MLVGGVGLVTVAEANGVGSGLAATAVAVMPIWAALWSGVFGRWPTPLEWSGMVLGLVGVIVLAGEGDFTGNPLGMALMIIAPISWAFGSIIGGRTPQAPGSMAVASYMAAGGVLLLVLGITRGERFDGAPDASGWMALLYLTFLGSIVTLTAYTYLLNHVRPALATSYAYVNPVVAVVLGVTLGSEVLSGEALIALPLILGGVGLVAAGRTRRPRESQPVDADHTPEVASFPVSPTGVGD
jgi:drug/metabolite transporter (DMT)-like permease